MIVLGIDTTGPYTSVGISRNGKILVELDVRERFKHSEVLNRGVEVVLELAGLSLTDVERVSISIGPGYFTALRVSLSFAKALHLALGVPIVAVESLYGIARRFSPSPKMRVIPLLDAQKQEVYASSYIMDDGLKKEWGPILISPDELKKKEKDAVFIGEGAHRYRDRLPIKFPYFPLFPGGGILATIGEESAPVEDPEELEPLYVRPPDAVLKKRE